MGVMSCSRNDCDNILCDTYVQSIGYICYECKSEFKEYLKKNGLNPTSERQINNELEKFMDTSKDSYTDGNEIAVDYFFDQRTSKD